MASCRQTVGKNVPIFPYSFLVAGKVLDQCHALYRQSLWRRKMYVFLAVLPISVTGDSEI